MTEIRPPSCIPGPRSAPGVACEPPGEDVRPSSGSWLRRRSVIGAAALGVALAALVAEAPAVQADSPCTDRAYPVRLCKVAVSSSQVTAGTRVVVTAYGFQKRSRVRIYFRSRQILLMTVRASRTGRIWAAVRIPRTTAAGIHKIILTGAARNGRSVRTLASPVRVYRRHRGAAFPGSLGGGSLPSGGVPGGVLSGGLSSTGETSVGGTAGGATAEEHGGGLAATGAALAVPAGALGGILLLAGGVFLVAARRRRDGTDAAPHK
jgi:hypothetical protein